MQRLDEPRQKHCRRYNNPGHAHALTFSCFQSRPFMQSDRTCGYFIDALTRAREKHCFDLWAYVVMPEHIHLLILPKEENYSISCILASIKQSVARRAMIFLRRYNPTGLSQLSTGQKHPPYRFWQDGGGYDRNLVRERVVRNTIEYIHHNPIRRGLVNQPEDWEWSSCRAWMGIENVPIAIERDSVPC